MLQRFSSFLDSQKDYHSDSPVWEQLGFLAKTEKLKLTELFATDAHRADQFSLQAPHLFLDYSKQKINSTIFKQLIRYCQWIHLAEWKSHYFTGSPINFTENRAVGHTLLRNLSGANASSLVLETLNKIKKFSTLMRDGALKGFSQKAITDIVCIGVGGSHLGPETILKALEAYNDDRFNIHFVSNVDGFQLLQTLKKVKPETTLFIISSKTFTTAETRLNAESAKAWFLQNSDAKVAGHFVAITTNSAEAEAFGVKPEYVFPLWEWVGGRFSLWSAIGLPIALGLGYPLFEQLLVGANAMDHHFKTAPDAENAPTIAALMTFWNATFLNIPTHAILPYDQCLGLLPAYLQQAEMESNGKSTRWDGSRVDYPTCPIIWGQLGINGQHAFYQLLHQGAQQVSMDFIASAMPVERLQDHHHSLFANALAQSQALMQGISYDEILHDLDTKGFNSAQIETLAPHKVHLGNKPSNFILLEKIKPESIGALIAFYEHKIFVEGILWQICSFDQWGVELGKVMAKSIEQSLSNNTEVDVDSSTQNLMRHFWRLNNKMN